MPFKSSIDKAIHQIEGGFEENLLAATMEWHAGVVEDMLVGDRSGREYRIPGSTRTYRASMPGEAPATRTGALRNSYRFRTRNTTSGLVGEVGSYLDYAVYLENGTKRMAPRPHLLPAYYKREKEIKRILRRVVI